MTKGGARSRSGPPPDPNAIRRSRKSDPAWTKIPANAREGKPAPVWPLVEPAERELALWESWWSLPIAELWADAFSRDYVALTVRMFAEAEQPKARTEDRKSLNQMMANLYLTPDAQLRGRILIVDTDNEAPAVVEPDATVTDIRGRLNRGAS